MKKLGPKCLECGKTLAKVAGATIPDCNGNPITLAARGHRGNGIFCTANCALVWAVRWAKRILFWR